MSHEKTGKTGALDGTYRYSIKIIVISVAGLEGGGGGAQQTPP